MNRYTQISQAKYNPYTLQELMAAPSHLRQKHDENEQAIALYKSELANIDALDIHNEAALARQAELNAELQGYADELASKGFSNMNKSNIVNFNSTYQNEMKNGIIGKANAAKQYYNKAKADYIGNATKAGYSPEQANMNWVNHADKYNLGFDGKNITNIDDLYAPKYVDAVTEARQLFKDAGLSETQIQNLGTSEIKQTEEGTYVLTESGGTQSGNNRKQLKAAVDYLNNHILNKNSDVHRSLVHQGKNPQDVLNEIKSLAGVYEKSKFAKSSGSKITNFNPLSKEETATPGVEALTVVNQKHTVPSYSDMNYSDLNNRIGDLEYNSNKSHLEKEELYKLRKYKNRLDTQLQHNENYEPLNKELSDIDSDIESFDSGNKEALISKYMSPAIAKSYASEDYKGKAYFESKLSSLLNSKKSEVENSINDIKKTIADKVQLTSTTYTITPTKSKDKTDNTVFNYGIGQILSSEAGALSDNATIQSVISGNESKNITGDNDIKGISKLFHGANPKDISIINFTPVGFSGRPEYTIRLNTTKGKKYNLDGWGTYGNIGNGEPVDVTVSFEDTSGGLAKNMNGYLQEYILRNTGEMGKELVNSMNINSTLSKYKGESWNNILGNEPTKTLENNPALYNIYNSKMTELMNSGLNMRQAFDKLKTTELYD